MCKCNPFCCCKDTKPASGTTECKITPEIIKWVSSNTIATVSGRLLRNPIHGGYRPRQTINVDCHDNILDIPRKYQPASAPPQYDQPHIGKVSSYSSLPGKHIFAVRPDIYYGGVNYYSATSYTDPSLGTLMSRLDLCDSTGIEEFTVNYTGINTIDTDHRYAMDMITNSAIGFAASTHVAEVVGGDLPGGLEYGLILRGPNRDAVAPWVRSPTPPVIGSPWPDPLGRAIMVITGSPAGGLTDYYVYPRFSYLNLANGTTSTDPEIRVLAGTSSAGETAATLYWYRGIDDTIGSATQGIYEKNYELVPGEALPEMWLKIDDGAYGDKRFRFWSIADNERFPGRNYEILMPPHWQYQPAGNIGSIGNISQYVVTPYSPAPDPTDWVNTQNYYYKSRVFNNGKRFKILPYLRPDNSEADIDASRLCKAEVDGLPVLDTDGNDGFMDWNYVIDDYNNATLVLICQNGDFLFMEELTRLAQIPLANMPNADSLLSFNPSRSSIAVGWYNNDHYTGLFTDGISTFRISRYNPYHHSPARRWKEYGFTRPKSRAAYEALVAGALHIEDVAPPSYSMATNMMITDVHMTDRPVGRPGNSESLPIDIQIYNSRTSNWESAPSYLPSIAKNGVPDDTNDKTGIKGRYRLIFDGNDVTSGSVMHIRHSGPPSFIDAWLIEGASEIPLTGLESGIWSFDLGATVPQKKNEHRTTVWPLDPTPSAEVTIEIDIRSRVTQVYVWNG